MATRLMALSRLARQVSRSRMTSLPVARTAMASFSTSESLIPGVGKGKTSTGLVSCTKSFLDCGVIIVVVVVVVIFMWIEFRENVHTSFQCVPYHGLSGRSLTLVYTIIQIIIIIIIIILNGMGTHYCTLGCTITLQIWQYHPPYAHTQITHTPGWFGSRSWSCS